METEAAKNPIDKVVPGVAPVEPAIDSNSIDNGISGAAGHGEEPDLINAGNPNPPEPVGPGSSGINSDGVTMAGQQGEKSQEIVGNDSAPSLKLNVQVRKENIYENQSVIDFMKKVGGPEVLKNLRMMSARHYHSLSKTYLDKLGKQVVLVSVWGSETGVFVPLVHDGGEHIFRKLLISLTSGNLKNHKKIMDVLKKIAPHLEKIQIKSCSNMEYCLSILQEVMEFLTNLTHLEIEIDGYGPECDFMKYNSKLRELFEVVPQRVIITISVEEFEMTEDYPAPDILFPSRQVQIKAEFRITSESDIHEHFNHRSQMPHWYQYNNISFTNIIVDPYEIHFQNNMVGILESFGRLMSTMDEGISMLYEDVNLRLLPKNFDLFGPTSNIDAWGHLISLMLLKGYKERVPVEKFPNLTYLELNRSDYNTCLLSADPSKDQEILSQRFKGKKNLEVLLWGSYTFEDMENPCRIQPNNELAATIKKHVQKLVFKSW